MFQKAISLFHVLYTTALGFQIPHLEIGAPQWIRVRCRLTH